MARSQSARRHQAGRGRHPRPAEGPPTRTPAPRRSSRSTGQSSSASIHGALHNRGASPPASLTARRCHLHPDCAPANHGLPRLSPFIIRTDAAARTTRQEFHDSRSSSPGPGVSVAERSAKRHCRTKHTETTHIAMLDATTVADREVVSVAPANRRTPPLCRCPGNGATNRVVTARPGLDYTGGERSASVTARKTLTPRRCRASSCSRSACRRRERARGRGSWARTNPRPAA